MQNTVCYVDYLYKVAIRGNHSLKKYLQIAYYLPATGATMVNIKIKITVLMKFIFR